VISPDFLDLARDIVEELGEAEVFYIKGSERREITAIMRQKMPKSLSLETDDKVEIDGLMAIFFEPSLDDWTVDTHDKLEARGILYDITYTSRTANGLTIMALMESAGGFDGSGTNHTLTIED
jgi:hypothetical protein